MLSISIKKELHFGGGDAWLECDTTIDSGEFVSLAGDSGSGKTTLLRVLAGLQSASGKIVVDDKVWLDGDFCLPPQKRGIGFVFQDYALFDNMSVEKNLLFVNKDKALAKKLLDMTNLYELKDRATTTLSGGQKQRLSLCRAMMNRPKLLLMDEPLSALDPYMRQKLQDDILSLHTSFGTTTILVSHDPSEIYKLSNRVIVLKNGKITKDGTPKDVLLNSFGSQKFAFNAKILDIVQVDILHIAVVSIGQNISQIVLDSAEALELRVGDFVSVSTKAFIPMIHKTKNL